MNQAHSITATIMGCGSSGGVPRVGNNWGDCDRNQPRNRRRRCSLLIKGKSPVAPNSTNIIVDTGCDLREQLLDADIGHVDAVFYTHEHADHSHGIDDLRAFALSSGKRVDIYLDQRTATRLAQAFEYCFEAPEGSSYPPTLNMHLIEPYVPITIEGAGGAITVLPIMQEHGSITTLGFKIADFVYSCDVSGFPEKSLAYLQNLDTWVLDALRPVPHPSHLSLPEALGMVARMKPDHAILTNLHVDMDYQTLCDRTPDGVQPAYDGLMIDIVGGSD